MWQSSVARIICRCLLILVAIWSVATGVIFIIQSLQPTPRKFMSYVAEHPLEGQIASERAAIIDHVARQLNGLSFEQRQELKDSGTIRTFFAQLTPEERRRFMAMTLPEGFRQLIATLNRMDPVQRKRLAQRTLRNVRERNLQASDLGGEDEIAEMISRGIAIFNEEAHPQVKLDFAAVIQEIEWKQAIPQTKAISQ